MKDHSPCYQLSRTVMGEHVPLDNLRLELSPTCFYILPYHHLEFAKFESGDADDTLIFPFSSTKCGLPAGTCASSRLAFRAAPSNGSNRCRNATPRWRASRPVQLNQSKLNERGSYADSKWPSEKLGAERLRREKGIQTR